MRWFNLFLLCTLLLAAIPLDAKKKKKPVNALIPRELIAYNTLQFGVSSAEYKALYADSIQQIGSYKYIFRPTFTNDRLTALTIFTHREDAKDFKLGGLVEINALVDYFVTSLGAPSYQLYVPPLTSFNTYQKEKISNWQLGTKNVEISVVKCSYELYEGVCNITGKQ